MPKFEVVQNMITEEWNVVRIEGCGRAWEASFDTEEQAIDHVFDLRAIANYESMIFD